MGKSSFQSVRKKNSCFCTPSPSKIPKDSDDQTLVTKAHFIGFSKISILKNASFENVEKRYMKTHNWEPHRSQERSEKLMTICGVFLRCGKNVKVLANVTSKKT